MMTYITITTIICWWSLRNFKHTAVIVYCSGIAAPWSFYFILFFTLIIVRVIRLCDRLRRNSIRGLWRCKILSVIFQQVRGIRIYFDETVRTQKNFSFDDTNRTLQREDVFFFSFFFLPFWYFFFVFFFFF